MLEDQPAFKKSHPKVVNYYVLTLADLFPPI